MKTLSNLNTSSLLSVTVHRELRLFLRSPILFFFSPLLIMTLSPGHIHYCRDHFANSLCDQGCDSAPCGWDSSECFKHQSPVWAKGTLILHTRIPHQRGASFNSSVLWALSVLLLSPLKLRDSVPLATTRNLFDFNAQELANMLAQASPAASDGWVLRQIFLAL